MSKEPAFTTMTQRHVLMVHRPTATYPISIEEWDYIKNKLRAAKEDVNFFHTTGAVLIGVAGSALIGGLGFNCLSLSDDASVMPIVITWAICVITFVCGCLALYFGKSERQHKRAYLADVVSHMELIEKRFETPGSEEKSVEIVDKMDGTYNAVGGAVVG